ncbi:hypothetical protein PIB30_082046 [Stylosanthes scabra]|uniref:Uncharacterized protein n=1 Tax=Stylosanthes scabra TaxID=79078 RepID=A0ABU6SSX1_9FABA|nr:hypothetical protein [Stylosanthes scabra]
MAENLQVDRAAAVVQIPRELPSIYRWVTNDVLGMPSSLDQQYLDKLKLTGVLFGGGDLEHTYRGRYFKIFPVGDHRPFWLSLEGDGLFPPYWSDQAGFDVVPVTYQRLNADQRDTADILLHLFSKNNLAPKSLLSNTGEARRAIVEIGNDVTLSRLRNLLRPPQAGSVPQARVAPAASGPSSLGRASTTSIIWSTYHLLFGRKSCADLLRTNTPPKKGALRDYDPVESVRWAEWAMLRAVTILKSVEPRLTVADEVE